LRFSPLFVSTTLVVLCVDVVVVDVVVVDDDDVVDAVAAVDVAVAAVAAVVDDVAAAVAAVAAIGSAFAWHSAPASFAVSAGFASDVPAVESASSFLVRPAVMEAILLVLPLLLT